MGTGEVPAKDSTSGLCTRTRTRTGTSTRVDFKHRESTCTRQVTPTRRAAVPRRSIESVAEWCWGAQDRRSQLPASEGGDGPPELWRSLAHTNWETQIGLAVINMK